jgi:hypothetical protein
MKPSVADILIFAKRLLKRAEFHYQQRNLRFGFHKRAIGV